jgi:flagellar basal body-associated protein FliL
MFDPVIVAILVVVLTAVGAAIVLLGAKATETKAKKVPERVVSKPDACPASPADSSLAAESFTNILNKKPPERVVWEEVEGIAEFVY